MRYALAAALSLAVLSSSAMAAPGDMNADRFYLIAKDLMGKGMGAMFDKRTKPVMAEMKGAAEAVRAENKKAEARGAPIYCVPAAARKKGMNPQMVVDKLGAIPAERRRKMTLTQAWREALVRDYPC